MKTEIEKIISALFPIENLVSQSADRKKDNISLDTRINQKVSQKTQNQQASKLKDNFLQSVLAPIIITPIEQQDRQTLSYLVEQALENTTLYQFLKTTYTTKHHFYNQVFEPFFARQNEKELSLIKDGHKHPDIQALAHRQLVEKSQYMDKLFLIDNLKNKCQDISAIALSEKQLKWESLHLELQNLVKNREWQHLTRHYKTTKLIGYKAQSNYNSVEAELLKEKMLDFRQCLLDFYSIPEHWAYLGDPYEQNPLRASYGFSSQRVFKLICDSSFEILDFVFARPQKPPVIQQFLQQMCGYNWKKRAKNYQPSSAQLTKHFYSLVSIYSQKKMFDKVLHITQAIGLPYIYELFLGSEAAQKNQHILSSITQADKAFEALDKIFISHSPAYQTNSLELRAQLEKWRFEKSVPTEATPANILEKKETFKL